MTERGGGGENERLKRDKRRDGDRGRGGSGEEERIISCHSDSE